MHLSRLVMAVFVLVGLCWCASAGWCAAAEKADTKDRMKALLKERVDTAKAIYDALLEKYNHGAGNIGSVHRAKMAWLNAQLSLTETKKERLKIYEEIVKDSKEWEQTALRNIENGAGEQIEALTARAERIEAEIALERARAELEVEKIPTPKP
jgi:outer membrane protein TolC